jgi:hypothetical protein
LIRIRARISPGLHFADLILFLPAERPVVQNEFFFLDGRRYADVSRIDT